MAAVTTVFDVSRLVIPGLHGIVVGQNNHVSQYKPFFKEEVSTLHTEYDQEVAVLPEATYKDPAGALASGSSRQTWRTAYEHVWIGLQTGMTKDVVEDNLYGSVWPKMGLALRKSTEHFSDRLAANVFNYGFSTTKPIADGQPFFSLSHPLVSGAGTVSNTLPARAQVNETAIRDSLILIRYFKDAAGLIDTYQPELLGVSPSSEMAADVMLGSKFRVGTTTNDINPVTNMSVFPKGYAVNIFFVGDNWFMLTNAGGLTHFTRTPFELDMSYSFDTKVVKMSGLKRESWGTSNFRSAVGIQGS